MRPKLLSFFIIGGIVILGLFSLLFLSGNKSGTPQPSSSSGNSLTISTPNGDVAVNDFTKNPVKQTANSVTLASTDQYEIVYFPKDKTFTITILSTPLESARDVAEAKFLEILGIGKGNACKLVVSLSVPYDVDQNHVGKDYGLSFCPSGSQF